MREPLFSDFPLAEYQARCEKARALMDERGIDALLLSEEENLRYFTGYQTIYFMVKLDFQLFLLPRDHRREGVLLLPLHLRLTAHTSWVEEARHWLGEGPVDATDQRAGPMGLVAETLEEMGLATGVIGMELGLGGRLAMSQTQFEELKARLPRARFVDACDLVWKVRSIKSEAEVAALRRACAITCKGYEAGLAALREGITEKEVAHVICSKMIEEGAEESRSYNPWAVFLQSGPYNLWCDSLPKDFPLRRGDLVMIDGGATQKSYQADMVRMGCIGEPTPEQRHMYEASRAACDAALEIARPGVAFAELFQAGVSALRDAGYGQNVDERIELGYSIGGHGIGLTIHEPPIVRAENQEQLQPGMVLALEFFVTDRLPLHEARDFLLVEQMVAITAKGHELLTPLGTEMHIA